MVQDLLRGFVAGLRVDDIDFSTLRKLPAEYVSDDLLRQHDDAVWQVRLRGHWLCLVVVLPEFQSRDEPRMALRILTGPPVRGAGPQRRGGGGRTAAVRAPGGAVQRRAAMAGGARDARLDRNRRA